MGVLFKVRNDVQACHQWSKLKCPRPYKGQKLSLDKPISYTIYMLLYDSEIPILITGHWDGCTVQGGLDGSTCSK